MNQPNPDAIIFFFVFLKKLFNQSTWDFPECIPGPGDPKFVCSKEGDENALLLLSLSKMDCITEKPIYKIPFLPS